MVIAMWVNLKEAASLERVYFTMAAMASGFSAAFGARASVKPL